MQQIPASWSIIDIIIASISKSVLKCSNPSKRWSPWFQFIGTILLLFQQKSFEFYIFYTELRGAIMWRGLLEIIIWVNYSNTIFQSIPRGISLLVLIASNLGKFLSDSLPFYGLFIHEYYYELKLISQSTANSVNFC